jgi:hypothetical protein
MAVARQWPLYANKECIFRVVLVIQQWWTVSSASSVSRNYKWLVLLSYNKTTSLNCAEKLSFLEKVVTVWDLAENCCVWGMETFQEPRGTETSTVGSRYQRTVEDTAGWEHLMRAIVNCRLCRSMNYYCYLLRAVSNKSFYQSKPLLQPLIHVTI